MTFFSGDRSRDLRNDDDEINDPVEERLTLAERNERLQNQLKSLKDELSGMKYFVIDTNRIHKKIIVPFVKKKKIQIFNFTKKISLFSVTRDDSGETTMDRIHKENVKQGRDKYKTLREVRKGNTKRRVDQFENM